MNKEYFHGASEQARIWIFITGLGLVLILTNHLAGADKFANPVFLIRSKENEAVKRQYAADYLDRWFGRQAAAAESFVLSGFPDKYSASRTFSMATITVTTTAQSPGTTGDCTLGEAITAANTNAAVDGCAAGSTTGTDVIQIPAGIYTLTAIDNTEPVFGTANGLPRIVSPILIHGAGPDTTVIERSGAAGTPEFRFFQVSFAAEVGALTLRNITLRNGRVPNYGAGAVLPFGDLTVDNCRFENNSVGANGFGGAIGWNSSYTLTINNSTFTGNTAGGLGGAVLADNLNLTNSVFSGNTAANRGGAVYANAATITGSSFIGNSIFGEAAGGAIFGGTLAISNSVFDQNSAPYNSSNGSGGAIYGSFVTITRSTVTNNAAGGHGGGIGSNNSVTVVNSTLSGNSANNGGGISANHVAVSNGTVSGNRARENGGGLVFNSTGGSLSLNNATITNNTADSDSNGSGRAGGIYHSYSFSPSTAISVRNTIIAANISEIAPDCAADFGASILSQGYNLIGNSAGCNFISTAGDLVGTPASPINPQLGPLAGNGGATQTHIPLTNSPVVDAGNPATPDGAGNNCLAADQRGTSRPADGNNDGLPRCDIGAVEIISALPPGISVNDVSITEGNSGTSQLAFTVSLSPPVTNTVSVNYSTSDGTAAAGSDYVAVSAATLVFNPEETSKTVRVTINGDTQIEPDETFQLNLSDAVNATIIDGEGTGTIINDDLPACIPVSIPTNLTGMRNSTLTVPVNIGNTTGQGIISFDFTLTYNPEVLTPLATPFDTNGTLSNGFTVTANSGTPGRIVISGFNSAPLSGEGILINLKFNVTGPIGAGSSLNFTSFRFNENSPCSTTGNGHMQVIGGTISGTVTYGTAPAAVRVPAVTVTATGGSVLATATGPDGTYNLSGFGPGSYTVTPSKTGQINNSITAFDASLVSRYVIGTATLDPNQQLAADASGNGTITSFDAALIAQYVINIPNPASVVGAWKFVPASRAYASVETNQSNQNYTAILIGEVSGNWPAANPPAKVKDLYKAEPIILSLGEVIAAENEKATASVWISDVTGREVTSYELDVLYDPGVLQPVGISLVKTLSHTFEAFSSDDRNGRLKIAAYGATTLAGSGALLNIEFRVIGSAFRQAPLVFARAMLNEGNPPLKTVDCRPVQPADAAKKSVGRTIRDLTAVPHEKVTAKPCGLTDGEKRKELAGRRGTGYLIYPARGKVFFSPLNSVMNLDASDVRVHMRASRL